MAIGSGGGINALTAANASAVPGAFWTPPTQPSARTADAQDFGYGILGNDAGWTTADFYALWEALRNAHSGYITRSTPGKDQSNTYDWWVYQFTPANYEKTMVITANIHGGEVTSILGLFRFLYHVANDWRTYPALSYLRNKVRLIVIPSVNPHGLAGRQTLNSRGVNLIRNSSYNWSANSSTPGDEYRGTSEFSELEAQYLRDLLSAYATTADVYIDCHNLGNTSGGDQVYYVPSKFSYDDTIIRRVVRFMDPTVTNVNAQQNDLGLFTNYAASAHSYHPYLVEYADTVTGGTTRDSAEMTRAVKWYGNMILQAATIDAKPIVTSVQYPRTWYGSYSQTTVAMEISTGSAELTDLRLTLPMPGAGILTVNGEVVAQNASGSTATIYMTPSVYQDGSDFVFPDAQRHQNLVVIPTGQVAVVSFSCVARVLHSNTIAVNPVQAQVRMTGQSSHTLTFVNKYRVCATWLPSTLADALTLFSATDRNGLGAAAMLKVYPT